MQPRNPIQVLVDTLPHLELEDRDWLLRELLRVVRCEEANRLAEAAELKLSMEQATHGGPIVDVLHEAQVLKYARRVRDSSAEQVAAWGRDVVYTP
jgi:hypothetical protein